MNIPRPSLLVGRLEQCRAAGSLDRITYETIFRHIPNSFLRSYFDLSECLLSSKDISNKKIGAKLANRLTFCKSYPQKRKVWKIELI